MELLKSMLPFWALVSSPCSAPLTATMVTHRQGDGCCVRWQHCTLLHAPSAATGSMEKVASHRASAVEQYRALPTAQPAAVQRSCRAAWRAVEMELPVADSVCTCRCAPRSLLW